MRQPCPHTQALQPTTVNRRAHVCKPSSPHTWDEENLQAQPNLFTVCEGFNKGAREKLEPSFSRRQRENHRRKPFISCPVVITAANNYFRIFIL